MAVIDTELFARWNRHLAGIAASEDPGELPELLMDALCTLIDADQRTILVFGPKLKPINLCEWSVENWPDEDLKKYMTGAYLLDPYYRAGIDGIEPGLYRMSEIAPPAFKESEYCKTYYSSSPIEDEIGFITYLTDDCFANLAFNRMSASEPFSDQEIALIRATLPLVESLLLKYWLAVSAASGQPGSELYTQLEHALSVFGTSVLTPREAEVMRMYLYGHDTRSISERLKISAHTVSAHRKNAYARLDINSQAELFSLFINSMYCFDDNPGQDPLLSYLNAPSQPAGTPPG